LHFGLGTSLKIDKVEVLWQDGAPQSFKDVAADRFYQLKQGGNLTAVRYAPGKD
jgi:hypothetical protein